MEDSDVRLTVVAGCVVLFAFAALAGEEVRETELRYTEPKEEVKWPPPLRLKLIEEEKAPAKHDLYKGDWTWWRLVWGESVYLLAYESDDRALVALAEKDGEWKTVSETVVGRRETRMRLPFTFKVDGGALKTNVLIKPHVWKNSFHVDGWWSGETEFQGRAVNLIWRPGLAPVAVFEDTTKSDALWVYYGPLRLGGRVWMSEEGAIRGRVETTKVEGLMRVAAPDVTYVERESGGVRHVYYPKDGAVWLPAGTLENTTAVLQRKYEGAIWRLEVPLDGLVVKKGAEVGAIEPIKALSAIVAKDGRVSAAPEFTDAQGRDFRLTRNGKPVDTLPTFIVEHKGKEVFRHKFKYG